MYEEIQNADTVGTFQIESRAQMQTLLRTRPENLDDLTIQVAIMRPGPIQSKSVHPFIDRRQALRENPGYVPPVEHPLLEEPLRETLGTIIFQDQVLEVAMAVAGFSIGEAEGLRRALSRKRSEAAIEAFRERFVEGAMRKGVDERLAHEIYDKVRGFAGFGFPKSHSAAFALLAYQSAWLRHHHPGEFLCALLNEQPMGFYPPASLVRDAQKRGVEVLSPDVNRSGVKARMEHGAVRVGLNYVAHVSDDDAAVVVASQPFVDVRELAQRTELSQDTLESLVASGACDCFGSPRRVLLWELGLVPQAESVPGLGRQGTPARAAARSDGGDAGAARAHSVGADARRLPHDEPLRRRAPAASSCVRTCPRACCRAPSSNAAATAGASAWRGWRSRGSGRRRRRASSSCCSRTRSAR